MKVTRSNIGNQKKKLLKLKKNQDIINIHSCIYKWKWNNAILNLGWKTNYNTNRPRNTPLRLLRGYEQPQNRLHCKATKRNIMKVGHKSGAFTQKGEVMEGQTASGQD